MNCEKITLEITEIENGYRLVARYKDDDRIANDIIEYCKTKTSC
jgi:hypothetical protein